MIIISLIVNIYLLTRYMGNETMIDINLFQQTVLTCKFHLVLLTLFILSLN